MNPISVVEILGPAEQGVSRPYRCRGEDGLLYYVKGRQTDRHSLWSEWLCGHLALAFGLKIPPFKLMEISEDLLMETRPELRNIGAGIAFGSQRLCCINPFEYEIPQTPDAFTPRAPSPACPAG